MPLWRGRGQRSSLEAARSCGVVRDGRAGELNEAALLPRARERALLERVFGGAA